MLLALPMWLRRAFLSGVRADAMLLAEFNCPLFPQNIEAVMRATREPSQLGERTEGSWIATPCTRGKVRAGSTASTSGARGDRGGARRQLGRGLRALTGGKQSERNLHG
jgi:hypothetical protein